MKTVKTTLVIPKRIWINFKKMTGNRNASDTVTRMMSYAVRQYHVEHLLHAKPNSDWNEKTLKKSARIEIQDMKKNLSFWK